MLSAKRVSSRGLPSLKRTARTWVAGFALGGTYLMAGAMLVLSFELKSTPQLLGIGISKKSRCNKIRYPLCSVYGIFTYIDPITINQMCVVMATIPMDPSWDSHQLPKWIDPEKGNRSREGCVCFFSRFGLEKNIEKHVGLSCRIPTLPSIQLTCIYCV